MVTLVKRAMRKSAWKYNSSMEQFSWNQERVAMHLFYSKPWTDMKILPNPSNIKCIIIWDLSITTNTSISWLLGNSRTASIFYYPSIVTPPWWWLPTIILAAVIIRKINLINLLRCSTESLNADNLLWIMRWWLDLIRAWPYLIRKCTKKPNMSLCLFWEWYSQSIMHLFYAKYTQISVTSIWLIITLMKLSQISKLPIELRLSVWSPTDTNHRFFCITT